MSSWRTIVPPGNALANLTATYAGGQVFPINTISYLCQNSQWINLHCIGALAASDAQELVEGVERMEILYGVDTDAEETANYGTANYYVKADALYVAAMQQLTAANWAKVVSVRISLLVATIDDNLTAQPAVSF